MLRRALSVWGALVLLIAAAVSNASAGTTNDPADSMPSDCAYNYRGEVGKMLKVLQGSTKDQSDKEYVCNTDGQEYTVTMPYLIWAVNHLNMGGYSKGSLKVDDDGVMAPNPDSQCHGSETLNHQMGFDKEWSADMGGGTWLVYYRITSPHGSGVGGELRRKMFGDNWAPNLKGAKDQIKKYLGDDAANLDDAYTKQQPCWIQDRLIFRLSEAMQNGSKTIPDSPVPTDPTDPNNPNNPAQPPTDNNTRCSIIDIPCSLRMLFIPSDGFLTDRLNQGVGINVNIPITASQGWFTNITFAGQTFRVGADFSPFTFNEQTLDQFRFYAWWSTFLFLLAYLGVPFLGGRKGMADSAQDSTVGAANREQASNDRAKADYDRLRSDDSWK